MANETNGPDSLTIRDTGGNVIATPHVGSQAMTWRERGPRPVRAYRTSAIGGWVASEEQRHLESGGETALRKFLTQIIWVRNEYTY